MAPSLTSRSRNGDSRPASRASAQDDLVIPNRTSSLHSRITQPMPSQLNQTRSTQKAPKTLTHAYMVCGVGREPSQWVRAPPPTQGKIGHMKNAVGQFWLPEILGSSPRLEQDHEIARSLHAAMRVSRYANRSLLNPLLTIARPVSLTTSRSVPALANHTASTTLSSSSKILHTLSTASLSASGLALMRSEPTPFASCARRLNRTITIRPTRHTGFHTV